MALLLNVPYAEKEEAKKLGARWNLELKKWYVQNREDYPKFKKWILKDKSEAAILCDYIYIIEGIHNCFKCGNENRVIGFGLENYYEFGDYEDIKNGFEYYSGEIHIASHINSMPNKILKYVQENYNYKLRYSKTVESSYYANCCQNCDVLQGDFFLFSEVDSPFWIEDEEAAKKLKLYRIPLKYDILVDDVEVGFGSNDYLIKEYGKIIDIEL